MQNRKCRNCGCVYSPVLLEGGRNPQGYKICPKCKSDNTESIESHL